MANALSQFLTAATADTIRCTNQFEVEAQSGYSEVDSVLKNAMIFGQSFTIPQRTVNYATVSFKGYDITNIVPTNIDMTKEMSIEMLDDINGSYRRAFLAWMNHVMNFDISGGSVFEGDRGVNDNAIIRLKLFGRDNKTISQIYKFYNVTVKNVSETQLQYSGGDTSKFTVQFGCTYWELEQATDGALTSLK